MEPVFHRAGRVEICRALGGDMPGFGWRYAGLWVEICRGLVSGLGSDTTAPALPQRHYDNT